MKTIKIELHLLQNFPPSCLNRDDTNTPKTCEFGGVTRARVSSQCWKRAVREHFGDIAPERKGIRSKRLKEELINALVAANKGVQDTLTQPVEKFVTTFYAGMDKKRKEETNVLLFWSEAEFAEMVVVLSEDGTLDELRKDTPTLKTNDIKKRLSAASRSTDVALFARMLADNPDMNIDAACQVAHAISTHAVNLELDFFTAVDDLNTKDETGAGMLGTVGYDSACYYRYALVDFKQLADNLKSDAEDALASLEAFLTAFTQAIPGAKKNSFAPGNPPFLALFVVRDAGTPASLVNAFAKPVNLQGKNLLGDSANALTHHAAKLNDCYDLYESADAFLFSTLDAVPEAAFATVVPKMKTAIANVLQAVRTRAESGE